MQKDGDLDKNGNIGDGRFWTQLCTFKVSTVPREKGNEGVKNDFLDILA